MNRLLLGLVVLLSLPGVAGAQSAVHRYEAAVTTSGAGLTRLPLPDDVLTRAAADLADLRLVTADGTELPYAIDAGPQQVAGRSARLVVEDLERSRDADSGQRPWVFLERMQVTPPPDAAEHSWTLTLDSSTRRFVRVVEVRAGTLADPGPLLGKGTIYRLRDPLREKLTVELPPLPAGPIVVQLRGSEFGYLEPRLRVDASWDLGVPPEASIPLALESTTSAEGTTTLVLTRPDSLVPQSLRLRTSTSTFERIVTVWDEGRGERPRRIGTKVLWRLDADRGVQDVTIPVTAASGDRLRVEITDGDSPPLPVDALHAVLIRPTLVFDAPDGPVTLRFGAERARRPDYDIAQLLGTGAWKRAEDGSAELFDPRALQDGTLTPVTEAKAWTPEPALAFASQPGAPVDTSRWSHLRELRVDTAPDHLVRVTLSPADLALARPDLADLRVVDSDGAQWPYLRDPRPPGAWTPLTLGDASTSNGVTRYPLTLGVGAADVEVVELRGVTTWFDRSYELVDGDGKVVQRGRLVREAGDPGPVTIALRAPLRTSTLVVLVTDGGDAPLRFTEASARVRGGELLAVLRPGTYRLLLGQPDASVPTYELARIRPTVMAVQPADATLGDLVANPERPAVDLRGSGGEKVLVWAVILVAVALLGFVTMRSARAE